MLRASSGNTSSGVIFWLIATIRKKERSGPGMATSSTPLEAAGLEESGGAEAAGEGSCGGGWLGCFAAEVRWKSPGDTYRKLQRKKQERLRQDFMAQTSPTVGDDDFWNPGRRRELRQILPSCAAIGTTLVNLAIRTRQIVGLNLIDDSDLFPGGPLSFRHVHPAGAAKNRSSIEPSSIDHRFKTGICKKHARGQCKTNFSSLFCGKSLDAFHR